jgi:hypothetical protein
MSEVKRDAYRIVTGSLLVDQALDDIRRIQRDSRVAGPFLIPQVSLADGTRTVIKHKLDRKYVAVWASPPFSATATGRIVQEEPTDRSKEIWLTATGHGVAITVDLLVWV